MLEPLSREADFQAALVHEVLPWRSSPLGQTAFYLRDEYSTVVTLEVGGRRKKRAEARKPKSQKGAAL